MTQPADSDEARSSRSPATHGDHPFFREPLARRARTPLLLFLIAAVIYCGLAGPRLMHASEYNHFAYLAESYLDGTLEMRERPPNGNDWASYEVITLASGEELRGIWWSRDEGKFLDLRGRMFVIERDELRGARQDRRTYVSFPPMPAILMLPFVAIWGTHFNDVIFTALFAALNVALMYVLLRRLSLGRVTERTDADNLFLTALFGVGSAHLWCSVNGQVWFTALVVGVTATLAYVLASIDARRPFLAGIFLAAAFAGRTTLLFSVVFFAAFFLFPGGRLRRDWGGRFWRDGLLFAAAPLGVGVALMIANYLRFESLGEFGHRYLAAGQIDRIKFWGLFNYHFVTRNLAAMFVLLPKFQSSWPWMVVSMHGLAIWFTTPAFAWLLWPRPRTDSRSRLWHRALWATVAAIAIPHLFYQNTGWVQFGYRFAMDYMVYLVVLLALGLPRLSNLFRAMVLWGIAVNLYGAIVFDRVPAAFADWYFEE